MDKILKNDIQIKTIGQYIPVVLFAVLNKVESTQFESVSEK